MERNTLTKICHLLPGDRFYKQGDKAKSLWTKQHADPKKVTSQSNSQSAIKDGDKFPTPMRPDTMVVFMRHAQPNVVG